LAHRRPFTAGNRRRRRRRLARRFEILRAAGREFRARGFFETGMRDIAAASDLSPANLYNYFRGKHEILFFCQDTALDHLLGALQKTRRLRATSAQKLHATVVAHLSCVLDEVEGSAAHFLASALPRPMQERIVRKRDRYEEGLRQLIAAGVRSGEFLPCDTALAARAILGALNWSVLWFRSDGALSVSEIAGGFADYLIRGLLAKPTAAATAKSKRTPLRRAARTARGMGRRRERGAL
jgi:AcrR family transcriptional regulator